MRTKLTEAEAIVAWIKLPVGDRAPLPAKQMELMERWNVADNLLREHLSERTVIPMLVQKFGYSESSARRDLDCARRVWGTRPRADKDYLANMLIDYLAETMVKAGKAQKYGEVARIAKVIIEAAGIGRKDEPDVDPAELQKPVALTPAYAPEQLGVAPMTDEQRRELLEQVLREKRQKGMIDMSVIAKLADGEE